MLTHTRTQVSERYRIELIRMGIGRTSLCHDSGWECSFTTESAGSTGSITAEHFMTISSSTHFDATDYDVRTLAITLQKRDNIDRLYVHCTTSNLRIWMSAGASHEAAVGCNKT